MTGMVFDKPPTPSCHASTIVETKAGQLLSAWFGGKAEGAKDVQIWLARFDGKKWGEPKVVGTEPGQPCWNPVLFQVAPGDLRLWYKAGPSPQTWTGYVRQSSDNGETWNQPTMLPASFYGPVRVKPIMLKGGVILAPTSVESHRCWTPYVDRSEDGGKTWTRSTPFHVPDKFGQIQPTLFVANNDNVVALMRSRNPLKICKAVSEDGGKTWSPAKPLELFNPSSGIDLVKTQAGDVFLIYNPQPAGRSPLSLARSTDDGETWTKVHDLETESGEYSYPAMIEDEAGQLQITYTWKRLHIKHQTIDPEKLRT